MPTREDALHGAICRAVSIMNTSVELVRTEAGRECRDILRKALVEYADAFLDKPATPDEIERHRKGHSIRKRGA